MTVRIPIKAILALIYSVTVVALVIAAAVYFAKGITSASTSKSGSSVIIIDVGHGGFDGGAVAQDGTNEKDLNLAIALKLRDYLNICGYKTIMTRESDISLESGGDTTRSRKVSDMNNRLALMNKYSNSITVSIHLNKFSLRSSHGAQVFYAPNDCSEKLAAAVQASIISDIQTNNSRVVKKGTRDTYILFNAKFPAIIVECGFLSNSAELEKLKNDDYQSSLAFSIAGGIMDYFKNKE